MSEPNAEHTKCGKKWHSSGNRTGHCALCHQTWEGVTLFDKHQRVSADGLVICLDPATIEFPKGYPLKQDEWGTWSSTKRNEHFGGK
jgi:hypothetical protein